MRPPSSWIRILTLAFTLFSAIVIPSGLQTKPAQAAGTCTPLVTTKVVNSIGLGVAGTMAASFVTSSQTPLYAAAKLDTEVDSSGNVTVCKPSAARFQTYIDDGLLDSSAGWDQLKFSTGDYLTFMYTQAGSSGSKYVYSEYVLTPENAVALNTGKSIRVGNVLVGSSDQFNQKVTSNGIAVANAKWSLTRVWAQEVFEVELLEYGYTKLDGSIDLSGLLNGNYRLTISPTSLGVPVGQAGGPFELWGAMVNVSNGVATFTETTSPSENLNLVSGNGSFHLKYKTDSGAIRELTKSELNALRITHAGSAPGSGGGNSDEFARVLDDGNVVLNIPMGAHKFQISSDLGLNPLNLGATTILAIRDPDGVQVFTDFTEFDADGPALEGSDSVNLLPATISWKYKNQAGSVSWADGFWLYDASDCPLNDEPITSCTYLGSVGMSKGLSVTSLSDGEYWYYHRPSEEDNEPAGLTILRLSLTTTDGKQRISWDSEAPQNLGTAVVTQDGTSIEITAPRGNIRLNIADKSGDVFAFAQVALTCQTEQCGLNDPSIEDTVSFAQTTSGGVTELTANMPGTFKMTVRPYRDMTRVAAAEFTITINDSFQVTSISPTSGSVATPTEIDATNHVWQIKLPAPTLSGKVLKPNEIDAMPWATLSYDCTGDHFGVLGTGGDGGFGLDLPLGTICGIEVVPGWGDPGVVSKQYKVLIDSNGDTCRTSLAAEEQNLVALCGESRVQPGQLNLALATPNLTGIVKLGTGASLPRTASVFAEFSCYDCYLRTTSVTSLNSQGKFAFNGASENVYELKLIPNGVPGYSDTLRYFKVDADHKICEANTPVYGESTTCKSGSFPTVTKDVTVELDSASFVSVVTYQSGTRRASNLWGQIRQVDANKNVINWWEVAWVSFTDTTGYASIGRVEQPTQYAVEITPEYFSSGNSQSLPMATKLTNYFYVGEFSSALGRVSFCPSEYYLGLDIDYRGICAEGHLLGKGDAIPFVLRQGNVSGTVTEPIAHNAVPNSSGYVEKWLNGNWTSTANNFNTNGSGKFVFDLSVGTYRLTAFRGWGYSTSLTPGKQIVVVESESETCLKNSSFVPTGSDSCATGDTLATAFNLELTAPNFSGMITTQSGSAAAGSQVTLYREIAGNRTWVATTSVGKSGRYGFNVDTAGNYVVVAQPLGSYFSTIAISTESAPITVVCPSACESISDADIVLDAPNVIGTLCTQDSDIGNCYGAAGVNISVMKWSGSNYVPISASARTDQYGAFALKLDSTADFSAPEGKQYQISFTPWNVGDVGAEVTTSMKVSAPNSGSQDDTCTSSALFESGQSCKNLQLKLASPNVKGQLTVSSSYQNASWSWVTIVGNSNSYYGSTGSNGNFAFNVADGTYTLTAYLNSNVGRKPPLVVEFTVTAGALTSWNYIGGLAQDPTSLGIEADFSAIVPNVRVVIPTNDPVITEQHLLKIQDVSTSGAESTRIAIYDPSDGSTDLVLTAGHTYTFTLIPNPEDSSWTCPIVLSSQTVVSGANEFTFVMPNFSVCAA